jgi:selenocysteine lyase/cysteine desulfurase
MSLPGYLDEFPVRERFIYFNHAATGPLPRRSAEAMQRMAADQMNAGGCNWTGWLEAVAGLRRAAAHLIGASASEIAVTKNTSEGLSFVANGLDWKPGDVVVAVKGEFPANYFPWARLERRGVKLRWLELRDGCIDLDELDQACQGARLLAVSFVQYLSGFRLDLDAAGEICRRRGCVFVVDAVQGLGPFPVDVKRSGIHALSASGHKWLLGPEGCAFFYSDHELIPRVEPVEFGWTNVRGFPKHSTEEDLRPDAGRYECGTLNTIGCFGLRASIELFLEAGVEAIAERVLDLTDRVAGHVAGRGFELAAPRSRSTGSGIVSFRKDGIDAEATRQRLASNGISVSARKGYIRASPHFYNSEAEIERFLKLLEDQG